MSITYKAWLSAAALIAAGLLIWVLHDESDCESKGGKRLRPVIGPYQCYDAKSLRPI